MERSAGTGIKVQPSADGRLFGHFTDASFFIGAALFCFNAGGKRRAFDSVRAYFVATLGNKNTSAFDGEDRVCSAGVETCVSGFFFGTHRSRSC